MVTFHHYIASKVENSTFYQFISIQDSLLSLPKPQPQRLVSIWPKGGSNNLKTEMRSKILGGGRQKSSRNWVGAERFCDYICDGLLQLGKQYKCYECLLILMLYTFPPQQMSYCIYVRMSEKVTGLKRRQGMDFQAYIHPAGQSMSNPLNPLHNLYETGLSCASSIGIIKGIKPYPCTNVINVL